MRALLCPTPCDCVDCNPPGFSVHGVSQARILWSGLPFPAPGDLPDLGSEPLSPAWLMFKGYRLMSLDACAHL